ncbi:hypothetical protein A0H81_08817 [Grifola frondosa]|uniref:Uncharacterized protein n=1 Tax=Grifola frondosa TaxID=5627 RepID=A0A1C7M3D9_GRIFR|nr:hypothetical protein A0H81_08817 [Grifola frondosa]
MWVSNRTNPARWNLVAIRSLVPHLTVHTDVWSRSNSTDGHASHTKHHLRCRLHFDSCCTQGRGKYVIHIGKYGGVLRSRATYRFSWACSYDLSHVASDMRSGHLVYATVGAQSGCGLLHTNRYGALTNAAYQA